MSVTVIILSFILI